MRRIDADMLTEVAPPASASPHIYVCGGTPLVEAVAQTLVELGHEPARVKTEALWSNRLLAKADSAGPQTKDERILRMWRIDSV